MNINVFEALAVALLSVSVPVFIFIITLLGNAIERAKNEEDKVRDQQLKDFELKITDMDNKIKALKDSGDSTQLGRLVKEFGIMQKEHAQQLNRIKSKYSALEFKNCVLVPGGLFLFAILCFELVTKNIISPYILWLLSIISMVMGVYKLCICLKLAQEISKSSEENNMKHMTEAFKNAMIAVRDETAEELDITFKNKFPLKCKINEDISINYKATLNKGKIAHDTEVWFFVPDGFQLIDPPEKDAWRQGEDFVIPNIRTIKIKIGNIRKHTSIPSSIKIKAPSLSGNYYIMYRLASDEYQSDREKLKVKVEEH